MMPAPPERPFPRVWAWFRSGWGRVGSRWALGPFHQAGPRRAGTASMSDRFALHVSLFYGAFFFYTGLSLPFMPAWLAAKGLDAREIGIVLAAPMVARIVVVPLSTRLADRLGMLQGALAAAALASVAGFALVG